MPSPRPLSLRAVLAALLLLLAWEPLPPTPAAAISSTLTNYIYSMVTMDTSIFAVTTSLYNELGGVQGENTFLFGPRVLIANPDQPQQQLLSDDTAFRTDTLSELFVAMVILQLDSTGHLPCGLDLPLPPSVLPPYFANETYLQNPAFPGTPITLRNILQHTSSINEVGFLAYAQQTPVAAPVSTMDEFVASLFETYGAQLFSAQMRPGDPSSFYFSRNNIALASYIANNQLALMQRAAGTAEENILDIGGYLVNHIFPIIGLAGTFPLTRTGTKSNTAYPVGQTTDWLPYMAIQDVDATGTSVVTSLEIHPAYTADFMYYTTATDLTKLIAGVLMPGGPLYSTVGARIGQQGVAVSNNAVPYVTARGVGAFNMSYTQLCTAMAAAGGTAAPRCVYNGNNTPTDTSAFGIFASGEFNQVAVVCFPTLLSSGTWCSASSVAYFQNASNVLSTQLQSGIPWQGPYAGTFNNWPLLLSVASMAEYTSYVPPPTSESTETPTAPTTTALPAHSIANFGWYVFLGVVAAIVLVIVASYVADYFIQPAPPAKIIVPVPPVPTAAEAAAGGSGDGGSGGGGDLLMGSGFGAADVGAGGFGGEGYPPGQSLAGPFGAAALTQQQQQLSSFLAGGGVGDGTPEAFARGGGYGGAGLHPTRLSLLDDDDDRSALDTTPTTTTTASTYTSTTTTSNLGVTPEGLRRRRPHARQQQRGQDDRGDGGMAGPRGGRGGLWRPQGEAKSLSPGTTEGTSSSESRGPTADEGRSTSNSQDPNRGGGNSGPSHGVPRFDAYI